MFNPLAFSLAQTGTFLQLRFREAQDIGPCLLRTHRGQYRNGG